MNFQMAITLKLWQLGIACLLAFVGGAGFGFWNWAPHQIEETAAPAAVLAPTATSPKGSVIAERKTDPQAKPKQPLPKGMRAERVVSADITPNDAQRAADQAAAPCPKVHIDATVVRDKYGAGRVIISSPDGVTTNATDTVIESISIVPVHRWAAGASYGTDKTYGGWIDRDVGRMRLGVDVLQLQSGGIGARARIGFSFGE